MIDTVKMKINVDGMDEAQAKIDALYEKMTEAKTLAAELASVLDGLRLSFDVDREIDLVGIHSAVHGSGEASEVRSLKFDMNPESCTINIDGSQLAKTGVTPHG